MSDNAHAAFPDTPTLALNLREFGERSNTRPSLVLLHGLLGSSVNWQGLARGLAARHHCLVPDLRNHGGSPHSGAMDYTLMSADVLALMDAQAIGRVILIGHSMGGKAAMWLALNAPERVAGLVVVDIAPVTYTHRFEVIFSALKAMDLTRIKNRRDADAQLAAHLPSLGLRQFLLQNLVREDDHWRWRMNLPVLERAMPALLSFPQTSEALVYDGSTLFIHGADSDYVLPAHHPGIRGRFPRARFEAIEDAAHWVYAEQPQAFSEALQAFLSKEGWP